jgi:dolichol-phosphate mannosyltransferase
MFRVLFNDPTNAFKSCHRSVIRDCGLCRSSHINITFQLSLSALIRNLTPARSRFGGPAERGEHPHLRLRENSSRYLCTVPLICFPGLRLQDDLMAERLLSSRKSRRRGDS